MRAHNYALDEHTSTHIKDIVATAILKTKAKLAGHPDAQMRTTAKELDGISSAAFPNDWIEDGLEEAPPAAKTVKIQHGNSPGSLSIRTADRSRSPIGGEAAAAYSG